MEQAYLSMEPFCHQYDLRSKKILKKINIFLKIILHFKKSFAYLLLLSLPCSKEVNISKEEMMSEY